MDSDSIDAVLAGVPFLDICTPDQLRLLAFTSERARFASGDILFSEGDAADGAYALASGIVSLYEGDHAARGQRVRGPDTLVGEMGLLLPRPRRRTAKAMTAVDAVFIPRAGFSKLMRQYPEIAERAAERIREQMGSFVEALVKYREKDPER